MDKLKAVNDSDWKLIIKKYGQVVDWVEKYGRGRIQIRDARESAFSIFINAGHPSAGMRYELYIRKHKNAYLAHFRGIRARKLALGEKTINDFRINKYGNIENLLQDSQVITWLTSAPTGLEEAHSQTKNDLSGRHTVNWSTSHTSKQAQVLNIGTGTDIASLADQIDGETWAIDELRATVEAYLDMMACDRAGTPYVKKWHYEKLAAKFGRTEKAFEYRMQNISYILTLMGRDWLTGLKPAKNVGTNVAAQIERLIAEVEGRQVVPIVAFEIAVREDVKKKQLPVPKGSSNPNQVTSTSTQYARDPAVKAWVLKQAGGICECCKQLAPFNGSDGLPYLEVHHVRTLANKGSDRVSNTIAACPNCHRELHYGEQSKELIERLYLSINRLVRE